jgi:prophage regulatory protein
MPRPEKWLVVHGRRTTERDGQTIKLYEKIKREYGLTHAELCERLGVPPDRPSKWRNWVYGTPDKQGRPIPQGTYEQLLQIQETYVNGNSRKFMKRPEVAKLMAVSPMTIGRWSKTGQFPQPIKVGGSYLYERDEIEKFIEAKKDARRTTP